MGFLYSIECYDRPNRRGQNLRVYKYLAANPIATAVFHHGYSEYCGWHKRLFTMLVERGFNVFAYDAHGHGHSEPHHPDERLLVAAMDHLIDDAEDFVAGVAEPASVGRQVFAVAHSLGGTVWALLEARRPGTFAGFAFNTPGLGKKITVADVVLLQAVRGLAWVWPAQRIVPGSPWTDLTDEADLIRRVFADPLFQNGDIRIATANSIANGWLQLNRLAFRTTCPIYVQWAAADKLTCRNAARAFLDKSSAVDVTWHEIRDGAMHAMIHGRRGPALCGALVDWLEKLALRGLERARQGDATPHSDVQQVPTRLADVTTGLAGVVGEQEALLMRRAAV